MTTSARFDSDSVRLQAGGEAVIPLQIRNNGEVVEGYQLEVIGVPAAWTTVDPQQIVIFPGNSTTATLSFHPPRSANVPAGEMPFGVRVVPTEHPDETVVPEGVVEVLPFLDTTAELTPRTSRGRRRGLHRVAIDNRGNVPVTAMLDVFDPADALRCVAAPSALTVNPGHAVFANVRVRPVKTIMRGAPVTHPLQVVVSPRDGQAVTLDGSYLQEPTLPPWLLKAVLAALLLVAALIAIWFGLLKPTIESSAKDAVAEPVAQAAADAKKAQQGAEDAGSAAEGATGAETEAKKAEAAAKKAAKGTVVQSVTPTSRRLQLSTLLAKTNSTEFQVPAKQTLELTDLIVQNPQGDFGTVNVSLDDQVLINLALENFRDLDYHFVSPIRAKAGQRLVMTVRCNAVGAPPERTPAPTACDTALYFGGTTIKSKQA